MPIPYEPQLDLIIRLLESLPQRICDEMDKRDNIKNEIEFKKTLAHSRVIAELQKEIAGTMSPESYTILGE